MPWPLRDSDLAVLGFGLKIMIFKHPAQGDVNTRLRLWTTEPSPSEENLWNGCISVHRVSGPSFFNPKIGFRLQFPAFCSSSPAVSTLAYKPLPHSGGLISMRCFPSSGVVESRVKCISDCSGCCQDSLSKKGCNNSHCHQWYTSLPFSTCVPFGGCKRKLPCYLNMLHPASCREATFSYMY